MKQISRIVVVYLLSLIILGFYIFIFIMNIIHKVQTTCKAKIMRKKKMKKGRKCN